MKIFRKKNKSKKRNLKILIWSPILICLLILVLCDNENEKSRGTIVYSTKTSMGVRVGAIRAEITGGKGRSVTLCPPSGTFYSAYIRTLSISLIEILYDTIRARTQICAHNKREPRDFFLFFSFFFPLIQFLLDNEIIIEKRYKIIYKMFKKIIFQ